MQLEWYRLSTPTIIGEEGGDASEPALWERGLGTDAPGVMRRFLRENPNVAVAF